jgi:hypothetical protein
MLPMVRLSRAEVRERLATGFALDRLWSVTMGLPADDNKEPALRQLLKVLSSERTPYALIGGIAVQIYTREPRTTRDIDIALASYDDIPREALEAVGFKFDGKHEHSENWRAPGRQPRRQRTAIQFMVDKLTPQAVAGAETVRARRMSLRVASLTDLVRLKLEAAEEPRRRPSKRQSDIADVLRLLEEHLELERLLPDAKARISKVLRSVSAGLNRST